MELPSKHVLYLAKRIGARGAGSDGEAAAASYVLRSMRDLDIEVDMETFTSWKSDLHGLMLIYALAIAAYLVFRVSYSVSLMMSLLVFFVFQMETYTWALASRLLPRSSSSNVVARIRPAGTVKHTVLVAANYDSAKSSPLGRPAVARMYRVIYIISFACIIGILLVGIGGVGASLTKVSRDTIDTLWFLASPFALYLLALATVMFFGETRGRYTAGANDNASGIGVLLSVMSEVAAAPLDNTEVWGVATGRGLAGGRGMVAFLHRHRHLMRDAFVISVDHCGIGETGIVTREGAIFGFRCSWRLRRVASDASSRVKGLDLGKGRCRVKKGDGMAAIVRGYRAITIGGLKGGSYVGWRNKNDTLDTLERESLENTVRLVQHARADRLRREEAASPSRQGE
jgi:hypothetical protein